MVEAGISFACLTHNVETWTYRAVGSIERVAEEPLICLWKIEEAGWLRVVHARDAVVDESGSRGVGGSHCADHLVGLSDGHGAVSCAVDNPKGKFVEVG